MAIEVFSRYEKKYLLTEDVYLWLLDKNLRKKIEENPETPHYIETIRGVGYRFRA